MIFISYLRQLSYSRLAIIGTVVLAVLLTGWRIYENSAGKAEEAAADTAREVLVASVAELGANTAPLSIVGTVTSRAEAELRAESGGRVTRLNYSLGDPVAAGAIIAEFENALQRASVTQAKGALQAAEAQYGKTTAGARDTSRAITAANLSRAEESLSSARSSSVDTIRSIYGSNDELVRTRLADLFDSSQPGSYSFAFITQDQSLAASLETERAALDTVLDAAERRSRALTSSDDLHAEIERALSDTRRVKTFADRLSTLLTKAIQEANASASLSAASAAASAGRTSASASLSTLSGTEQNIIGLESALTVAKEQSTEENQGARAEDIAAARAGLTQAEGAYAAALASLEKTIVRSPISGTINSLSLKLGDYVTPSSQVAVVSNNGALEVLALVTPDDRRTIAVGNRVTIADKLEGTVTRIASAIDPTTRAIEVRIGLAAGAAGLTNGESVRVSIARSASSDSGDKAERMLVPISAVKLEPDRTIVFTVDEASKLVAHPVSLGSLFGDRVEIMEGITPEMRIVTDARGLKEGQQVNTAAAPSL